MKEKYNTVIVSVPGLHPVWGDAWEFNTQEEARRFANKMITLGYEVQR